MKRTVFGLLALLVVVMLVVTSCGPTPQTRRLSIATGGTGGVYYPLGGGMAQIITKYVKNTEVTAEVTPASVDNLKLIQTGKADIALTLPDVAYDAYVGRDKFTAAQWSGLAALVTHLLRQFPGARVMGHRDCSPDLDGDGTVEPLERMKECPCFEVEQWISNNMQAPPDHVLQTQEAAA